MAVTSTYGPALHELRGLQHKARDCFNGLTMVSDIYGGVSLLESPNLLIIGYVSCLRGCCLKSMWIRGKLGA
jgi:hypothetical protein